MKMNTVYHYRFHILATLFAFTLLAAWPGFMNPDSITQYAQAKLGLYSDHHPPLMSFIWHYLDHIYTGPGLMFLLQLSVFYAGIAILMVTLDKIIGTKKWLVLLLVLIPIYPQVLIYAITVVKDIQFALFFLFACSLLGYYTISKKAVPRSSIVVILLALIYGAAVKYQGQFCAIIPAIWLGCLLVKKRKTWKKLLGGIAIYALILCSIAAINNILVFERSKSFSWQCVKLYDLAAMSIDLNRDLIPPYNKSAFYSFKQLKGNFGYPSIDSCVYVKNSILRVTRDPSRMNILYKTWLVNVVSHPVAYAKHRFINLSYTLFDRPGFIYVEPYLNKIPLDTWKYRAAYEITSTLFYAFMSHFPVVVLGVFYFILSIVGWRHSKAAPVLLGFSSITLLMVGILFFMSMAGTPRYTYISIIMIHSMHAFAYICYKDTSKRAKR